MWTQQVREALAQSLGCAHSHVGYAAHPDVHVVPLVITQHAEVLEQLEMLQVVVRLAWHAAPSAPELAASDAARASAEASSRPASPPAGLPPATSPMHARSQQDDTKKTAEERISGQLTV